MMNDGPGIFLTMGKTSVHMGALAWAKKKQQQRMVGHLKFPVTLEKAERVRRWSPLIKFNASCCNTHPVANQESFHKSQGQLQYHQQQQHTIRNTASSSLSLYLSLSLCLLSLPRRGLLLHLFVCVSSQRGQHHFLLYR